MSRRVTLFETIANFFDFKRNRTGKSILLFLAGFAALDILINALFALMSFGNKWILYKLGRTSLEKPGEVFISCLLDLLVTIIIVLVVFAVMAQFRSGPADAPVTLESPPPHQGLIFLLSPYFDRRQSSFSTYQDIDLRREDARLELFKSNWGTLAAAAEHHGRALRHCWLVCTEGDVGSATQFEQASTIVRQFGNPKVICHKEFTDSNDVSKIANDVKAIYQKARFEYNLLPEQIIADFTGGTAAMSGGLILATVSADQKVEYVRQDKSLVKDNRALSRDEILNSEILITVVTGPPVAEA